MNKIAPSIITGCVGGAGGGAALAAVVLLVVGAAAVGSGDGAGVSGISRIIFF
jgi:hypothetical protein